MERFRACICLVRVIIILYHAFSHHNAGFDHHFHEGIPLNDGLSAYNIDFHAFGNLFGMLDINPGHTHAAVNLVYNDIFHHDLEDLAGS